MKSLLLTITLMLTNTGLVSAQDFITRGRIEYEVKESQQLGILYNSNGEISRADISNVKEFDISYRELIFADNQWMYKEIFKGSNSASRKSPFTINASRNTGLAETSRKFLNGQAFIMQDSLPPLKWKIQNETRMIAGWQCRKAITRIFDSVYVIAFYCPEIVPQAGPELFNGLPGMILGLAIPRYYTTWFATKIELADIDESTVSVPDHKKEKVYSKRGLADFLVKKYKEEGWQDVTIEKVMEMLNTYVY